jgi:hypothetical protein
MTQGSCLVARIVAFVDSVPPRGWRTLTVPIRTFLSFAPPVEIDGASPWRRALTSGATVMSRTAERALPSAD